MIDTIAITAGLWLFVGCIMVASMQFIYKPVPTRKHQLVKLPRTCRIYSDLYQR